MDRARSIVRPWIRFFAAIRLERDYFACSILAVIGIYSLAAALVLLFPFASKIGIERFQGRLPFYQWALLQPLPAMYNFENKVTVRPEALSGGDASEEPLVFWVAHHVHRVSGDGLFQWVGRFRRGSITYESRYRDVFVRTVYAVTTDEDGTIQLRRTAEPAP